ncbi:hypothetical protein F5X99DRAFT_415670 [Biscogniauxia marginata]|nr:hypothetical protein F5X99DRAFT_415670 [Biscogniauxia marginata]
MAPAAPVLSQILQPILLTKFRDIEKQRDQYEVWKNEVLGRAAKHPGDIRERITELLRGVADLDSYAMNDPEVNNIRFWLHQSKYDPSMPVRILQSAEEVLRSSLEVQSRRLGLAHLYLRLVTETIVPDDTSFEELCDKFEKVVFEPLETNEVEINLYLNNLFDGEEGKIQEDTDVLFRFRRPFNECTLKWCIEGLLVENLLSDEKQAILRDFLENKTALNEIARVLDRRFIDFENWEWQAGDEGIPVLPRQQLNGKCRIWMDEDVLQAIFIHYISTKCCIIVKSILTSFIASKDGLWNWHPEITLSPRDNLRRNYMLAGQHIVKGSVNDEPTESIMERSNHGQSAVLQSDLQWLATGLSYTTVFAVMRFFGFPEILIAFFRKVLEAPLNVVPSSDASPSRGPRIRRRGLPMAHAPQKLIGEIVLSVMDLAVNQKARLLLYRLHDDLFLCGSPSSVAQAWKAMKTMAKVMGLEFNMHKTGSVYLAEGGNIPNTDPAIDLPKGVVRIGHLVLDPTSGEWALDQKQVNEHVTQLGKKLGKQLVACTSILDWVSTWNNCMSRFFRHTFGEPAYCFRVRHIDSILETYQQMQRILFGTRGLMSGDGDDNLQGNVAHVPDAFIFFPEQLGGLAIRVNFDGRASSPDGIMRDCLKSKADYASARKAFFAHKSVENRLRILHESSRGTASYETLQSDTPRALSPGSGVTFFSFEEYSLWWDSTSAPLHAAYVKLLETPPASEPDMEEEYMEDILKEVSESGRGRSLGLQETRWALQMYGDDLKDQFGDLSLFDEYDMPLGVLGMMRRKAVR